MAPLSDTLERVGRPLTRRLGRATTILIGFVMTIAGLMVTSIIVLVPVGAVTALLGVAVFLAAVFDTDASGRA